MTSFKSMLETLREQVGEEEADRIVETIKADVEVEAKQRFGVLCSNHLTTRTAPESPCTCAEIQRRDERRHFRECPLREDLPAGHPQADKAIPMIMYCPMCAARHIDEGEFATKLHKDHACQTCGHVWRPALVATVGVQFLPGYKNAEPKT